MRTDGVEQPQRDPRHLRRAQPLNQAVPATWRWIEQLPADMRPLSLVHEFPRIANVLARAWPDAPSFAACIDSLLHDRRGGRRGFPGNVQSELVMLRDFFDGRYPTSPSALDRPAEADSKMPSSGTTQSASPTSEE
jgi:hypothetical protein